MNEQKPEEKDLKKVSKSSTKQEILDAYNNLLKKLK